MSLFEHVVDASSSQMALRKANGVQVTRSLFERRRGLATVTSTSAAGAISVGMVPVADATAVRDLALYAAETDPRPWI